MRPIFKDNKKLTTKEIAILSICSLRTADRIKAEIKKTIPKNRKNKNVTFRDYVRYYCE